MNLRSTIQRSACAGAFAALLVSGCDGGDDGARTVVVSIPEQNLVGAARATLTVDYSGAGARIVSEDGSPSCAFILPGIDGEFADDRQGTLTIRATGPRAMRGPADIAACRMLPSDPTDTAQDLHERIVVRLAGAEDPAGKAIDVTTAKAGPGGGAAAQRTQQEIEEAQAAAVKAAESIAPPPQPATEDADGSGDPTERSGRARGSATTAASGNTQVASAGAGAGARAANATPADATPADAAPAVPRASTPRPLAPASVPRPAAPEPVDDGGGQAAPVDRNRNYDDSPSDDVNAPAYDITVNVQSGGVFGALQINILHLGRSGGFIGRGDQIDCVSLVEAIAAANYVGENEAKVGLISLAGIQTPQAVVRCGFRTPEPLSPTSFRVVVVDAADTESQPLEPLPTVAVTRVTRR